MKNIYIISGPNGAGKTTASYTVLPDLLAGKEFVNADEIAKGISPFNPDSANIQAGRMMLTRIDYLLETGVDIAIETTLATRSYPNTIQKAQSSGYSVTMLFFGLNSVELAIQRVKIRVLEGGHNIPEKIIQRKYENRLKNFFTIFKDKVDDWMLINNSELRDCDEIS